MGIALSEACWNYEKEWLAGLTIGQLHTLHERQGLEVEVRRGNVVGYSFEEVA